MLEISMEEASKNIMVIDTDCGVDDALAIMMAVSHDDWKVLCITCCYGNVNLNQVCQNVMRTLVVCGKHEVPVYKGCEKALVSNELLGSDYHSKDGFGGVASEFPTDCLQLASPEHASNVLVRLAREHRKHLVVVALGPLTNIAVAQRLDPEFTKNLKELVIMGGNINGFGNSYLAAEFNFASDPEAANILLKEAECPVTVIPLEVCHKYALDWNWLDDWRKTDTPRGYLVQKMTEHSINRARNIPGCNGLHLCDLFAMCVVVNPRVIVKKDEKCVYVELNGQLTRGMMVVERRLTHLPYVTNNVFIVMEFNKTELLKMFKKMIL
ncbi:inosine-uridine preferring nucleoside hydrolase-like isoform X3 [Limulus polyphemus]|uniref:Inosine-uridine preferring nucleoside hydrolase-like isoform X2 n=1 Tax=Limulus polyphemus TaxID=6850 RepID=A0ABM1RWZ4_LIMPO|nr:inosine-uridine preferring nucleoside hydrolase-like isoform X2 [Limulus polyphemus]XP_022235899.1 inosine-uridine preferring nucleoside hydrolase-like isoform X3 [Limulus polyphemus]